MGRKCTAIIIVALWTGIHCLASAEMANRNLIPVKPSYSEAAYAPQAQPASENPELIPSPTPRDQLYVFWILGKLLSYPVDKAESFIMSKLRKYREEPVPTPASVSSGPNPFTSVNWREIPPAPPASVR